MAEITFTAMPVYGIVELSTVNSWHIQRPTSEPRRARGTLQVIYFVKATMVLYSPAGGYAIDIACNNARTTTTNVSHAIIRLQSL